MTWRTSSARRQRHILFPVRTSTTPLPRQIHTGRLITTLLSTTVRAPAHARALYSQPMSQWKAAVLHTATGSCRWLHWSRRANPLI